VQVVALQLVDLPTQAQAVVARVATEQPQDLASVHPLLLKLAQAVAKGLDEQGRRDLAAGFQASVASVLADRATHALGMLPGARAVVVAGGVAANGAVRAALARVAAKAGLPMVAPPIRLCTDNAVMVAWAGIERLRAGLTDGLDHAPRPRWPLQDLVA
jgi:N6-L-threonylcarbamoyladenine synthase